MQLLASSPYAQYSTGAGNFTADANGLISTTSLAAIADLVRAGCVPLASNPLAHPRNLIDGGDFSTNPWQRNIAGLASANVIASAITSTVTYFADRFFAVGGASSSILMAAVADTAIPGFSKSLKVSRSSGNSNTAAINFGQVIETLNSVKCQGQPVTLSFYAKCGADFSAASALMAVKLIYGTSTNDTAANMVAASWSGQGNVISTTQALALGYQRYSFTGTVPVTATQLGVLFSFTPVGTASTDDSISIQGVQLELGSLASPFEHRTVGEELRICQRRCFIVPEPAAGVPVANGMVTGASACAFNMPIPQMAAAPTVTVGTGSWYANIGGSAAATTLSAGSTHTARALDLLGTGTTLTAGDAAFLEGHGGAGYIVASADF